ncbi:hypothetical protein RND81_04G108900 [Saponaria officinalis]|uniref:Uncharacterized protein n=1 Tax=Saponaria officinalis TaxID=3572 RepID=A0AAW1LLS9_SAPOF
MHYPTMQKMSSTNKINDLCPIVTSNNLDLRIKLSISIGNEVHNGIMNLSFIFQECGPSYSSTIIQDSAKISTTSQGFNLVRTPNIHMYQFKRFSCNGTAEGKRKLMMLSQNTNFTFQNNILRYRNRNISYVSEF